MSAGVAPLVDMEDVVTAQEERTSLAFSDPQSTRRIPTSCSMVKLFMWRTPNEAQASGILMRFFDPDRPTSCVTTVCPWAAP